MLKPAPIAKTAPDDQDCSAAHELSRWLAMAQMQRRFYAAINTEIEETSDVVESSAIRLSEQFRNLSDTALNQGKGISSLIDKMQLIELDGKQQSYNDVLEDINNILGDMVDSIILFSKEAMRLVFTLEDVNKDVREMAKALQNIDSVNRQTQYLSINAAIEARKSGDNQTGNSFDIIANEIRDLSNNTSELAEYVKNRMSNVTKGIAGTYDTLKIIAQTDLEPQIQAREKIEKSIKSLLNSARSNESLMKEVLSQNTEMEKQVGNLTMSMQFQDYSTQKLQQIVACITFLSDLSTNITDETRELGYVIDNKESDETSSEFLDHVENFINERSLGEVKTKLLKAILSGEESIKSKNIYSHSSAAELDDNDDIELF